MVSVQLCNKNEYEASGELTECCLRKKCPLLKPSPSFVITGLNPEKKYQVYLSFKQIGNFRLTRSKQLSRQLPLPFNEPNVEHQLGIASGEKFMGGIISFEDLKITYNIQEVSDQVVHLNSCHKYTPVLKIMEVDSTTTMEFSFDEASFRIATYFVKRAKEIRMTDEEEEENLVKRQCHGPASEVPVLSEREDTQSQVEGHASPTVGRQDSSSMNNQSLISVKLANNYLYTKTDGLTECLSHRSPRSLRPSPVFSVTGLDREKNYRVFLSFKQTGNFRTYQNQPVQSKPFNEVNVEHEFGIASGEKYMEGTISFEGLMTTTNIGTAGGRTVHLINCHKYIPVLKIQEFDSQAAVSFFFDKAPFMAVSCLKEDLKRAEERRMTYNVDKEKKRQCTDDEDEVLYQINQRINTPIQDSLQEQSYQGQFQNRIRAPAQVGGQQVQLEEDAIHNQIQDQPDPQGHDEAVLAGASQDRFRADIQDQVHDQVHRQVPQGTVQHPFNSQIRPQHNQSGHLARFQAQPAPVRNSLHAQNRVTQGPAQLPFDARIHSQHNQFVRQQYDQLGHPRAPQVPVYPQIPVQASHSHVPNQPRYHPPQVPVHPPAQPPFNPNPMIPPHPGFNNPNPQYPYPPMHRPTMLPTQQYPHQFNHPSPDNPNFMPNSQMFPQQLPPGNIHPQISYHGPHHFNQ